MQEQNPIPKPKPVPPAAAAGAKASPPPLTRAGLPIIQRSAPGQAKAQPPKAPARPPSAQEPPAPRKGIPATKPAATRTPESVPVAPARKPLPLPRITAQADPDRIETEATDAPAKPVPPPPPPSPPPSPASVPARTHGHRPQAFVVTGLLAKRGGVRLVQKDADTLTVTAGGTSLDVPCRRVEQDGKAYLEVTVSILEKIPALKALLSRRYRRGSKAIRVHQLVAIVGRGSDLTGSAAGRVAVHHANLMTLDNRAGNLRTMKTVSHDRLHRWLDGLEAEAQAKYLMSVATDPEGTGEGLPDDLREAIEADLAELENVEDVPSDPSDQGVEGLDVPSDVDVEVEGGNEYYLGSDSDTGADEEQELAAETVEELLALGRSLGKPNEIDLATVHYQRLKLLEVAEAAGCGVLVYLLTQGHPTLTAGAVMETAAQNGDSLVYDASVLYRYNAAKGLYEPANAAFEKEVIDYAVLLAHEVRKVKMAASVWPAKDAAKLLKALPKLKGSRAVVDDCRNSAYPLWQTPNRMNWDQSTLNMENCLVDVASRQQRPHTPDHMSSLRPPYPFDPTATCPVWEAYLAQAVPDAGQRAVLQEFFGYCLIPSTRFEMILFLLGPGGTGKSTFIKTLRKLVGAGNCSAVALEALGAKFHLVELRDMLVNLVSEFDPDLPLNHPRLKAVSSSDPVTGERKFRDPFVFTPYARFVIAANTMPRVLDETDAFFRRLIVVRFDQQFVAEPNPGADPPELPRDPGLEAKLEAELPAILNWSLDGLDRLLARDRFDIPASMQANVTAFRLDQNNALRYLHDVCAFGPEFEVSTTDLYRGYLAWAKAAGEKPYAINVFGRIVTAHKGVQAKNTGGRGRFYKGLRPADAHTGGGAA